MWVTFCGYCNRLEKYDLAKMTIINKMLSRIFPRTIGICYVIAAMFLLLFFLNEMKQLYHKFQKGRRFTFYNNYVNEINEFADQIESSQIRYSKHVRRLSKVLKLALKKNYTDIER